MLRVPERWNRPWMRPWTTDTLAVEWHGMPW
jgi:hypothetical protein